MLLNYKPGFTVSKIRMKNLESEAINTCTMR